MQLPTLRQLEYFSALADTLNFREAAETCLVSQPGLSGQIAQLEATLRVQLFERSKRQVRLTASGQALLPKARRVLAEATGLTELAQSFGSPLTGPLRLGAIPTVGPYLLPRILPAVRAAHPELQLYLREDLTPRLLEQLEAGSLDLLLLATDVPLGPVETYALFSDPFLAAVRKDHPLANQDEVRQEQLLEAEVLLLEEGHCLGDQTLSLCQAPGKEALGFRSSSLSTIVQMVEGGLGITLLPELAVERELAGAPDLVTVPFPVGGPCREVGLAWRQGSPRAAEFRLLGETITQAYAEA
ncbi:MAG: LysR substrate-binding domain-containing protein [Planctomycetota bacterium]